mmetsp:Transcript_115178/g.357763  ORF Transcript_115178/g.357763 Transcript_115178/m.357763 type:complete len:218 (+) Transcript_115178:1541-2194(+)
MTPRPRSSRQSARPGPASRTRTWPATTSSSRAAHSRRPTPTTTSATRSLPMCGWKRARSGRSRLLTSASPRCTPVPWASRRMARASASASRASCGSARTRRPRSPRGRSRLWRCSRRRPPWPRTAPGTMTSETGPGGPGPCCGSARAAARRRACAGPCRSSRGVGLPGEAGVRCRPDAGLAGWQGPAAAAAPTAWGALHSGRLLGRRHRERGPAEAV